MKFYEFPNGFFWGAAMSAIQNESNPENRAKVSYEMMYDKHPEYFYKGQSCSYTCDMYSKYKEDFDLMKSLGFNSFRLSISWARLIPDGIHINETAKIHYRQVFEYALGIGLKPIVCLFHVDTPEFIEKNGGWVNRENIDKFIHYAEICFNSYGDIINYWMIHNEPIVTVLSKYLTGLSPNPEKKPPEKSDYPYEINVQHAIQAGYNIILSHAKTVELYKSLCLNGKIGTVLNIYPAYPRDSSNEKDVYAAKVYEAWHNESFADPIILGHHNVLMQKIIQENNISLEKSDEDEAIIKRNTIDFVGVNYYMPIRVKEKESEFYPELGALHPKNLYDSYKNPNGVMNLSRGWEIYEKGIYDISKLIQTKYRNIPWMISENGMGIEDEEKYMKNDVVQDDYRIDFIRNHLIWLNKSIMEGSNCFGYHVWTFTDNWSPLNAFKNRYGLVRTELSENNKRVPKLSAEWFKEVSAKNGFYWYK